MLIAFRVIQGLVAGPMIPLSQTLLLASYPREKSGTAMAMWAMTVLVAPVAGPLLGGWITDNIAWPWIFYINIPVGLGAAALTWSIYHKRDPGPRLAIAVQPRAGYGPEVSYSDPAPMYDGAVPLGTPAYAGPAYPVPPTASYYDVEPVYYEQSPAYYGPAYYGPVVRPVIGIGFGGYWGHGGGYRGRHWH